MRTPRARGFTLVELMIVVSIIGLLASTAIPSFLAFTFRTKRVERDTLILRIAADLKDHILRTGSCPNGGAALEYNPAAPSSNSKKQWDPTIAGWSEVGFLPEGFLYYRYRAECFPPSGGGLPGFRVTAVGDLDGDSVPAYRFDTWDPKVDSWNLADTTYFPDAGDREF